MAPMTARKAIAEGVSTKKIIQEDNFKGKQKIVFYTVHRDISENEKDTLDEMEELLQQFDLRFGFF